MLAGENIWILGGVLSFCAVSINFDSTFLKAFCQDGVEPSAFFNFEILTFNFSTSLPMCHVSFWTLLDFKIDRLMDEVSGETCIQKSLFAFLPLTPFAPIIFVGL